MSNSHGEIGNDVANGRRAERQWRHLAAEMSRRVTRCRQRATRRKAMETGRGIQEPLQEARSRQRATRRKAMETLKSSANIHQPPPSPTGDAPKGNGDSFKQRGIPLVCPWSPTGDAPKGNGDSLPDNLTEASTSSRQRATRRKAMETTQTNIYRTGQLGRQRATRRKAMETPVPMNLAPRASLESPTGDAPKGNGDACLPACRFTKRRSPTGDAPKGNGDSNLPAASIS